MAGAGRNSPVKPHTRSNLEHRLIESKIDETLSKQISFYFFGGERVYGPQNTLMMCCIIVVICDIVVERGVEKV